MTSPTKWEILERNTAYEGFFRLEVLTLRHGLYAGGWSRPLRRELIERSDAVAVLPYDPARDEVVLIEQFRTGAIESPQGPWLTETIAGLIEPGERAEDVAHREAMEEAGCELRALLHVCDYYSTPGGLKERVSIYVARVDTEGIGGTCGLCEEDEDIQVGVISADEAFNMLAHKRIVSAMPIIALQWLQMNRAMLRELWR